MGEIERVRGDDLERLKAFLARDPIQNLFALSVLEEYGLGRPGAPEFAFHAASEGGELRAVTFVGGQGELYVPCGDPTHAGLIGRQLAEAGLPLRSAHGERAAVDATLRSFGSLKLKIDQVQKLLKVSADDLGPFVEPKLRPAQDADLDELVRLSAAAIQESLGVDPLAVEGPRFTQRVAARVRAGRSWVVRTEEQLSFKIDMGVRCRYGAELENMYMLPAMRRRGLATLALGQVCRQHLAALPRLSVCFDDRLDSLARTCRKVGFVPVRNQRLVVAE